MVAMAEAVTNQRVWPVVAGVPCARNPSPLAVSEGGWAAAQRQGASEALINCYRADERALEKRVAGLEDPALAAQTGGEAPDVVAELKEAVPGDTGAAAAGA